MTLVRPALNFFQDMGVWQHTTAQLYRVLAALSTYYLR